MASQEEQDLVEPNSQQATLERPVREAHESDYFWAALMFYTRIPTPKHALHSQTVLDESRKYFPLIGVIVGTIASLTFLLASMVFDHGLSIALSMISTILATGAFHEDGFADTCDGFGGGWTKSQVLTIMKDSRVGTYATVGLVSILTLKFLALEELIKSVDSALLCMLMIAAHTLSRLVSSHMIDLFDYVQDIDQSKVKPITESQLSRQGQQISFMFGLVSIIGLAISLPYTALPALFLAIICAISAALGFMAYSRHRIGGYTGDVLGSIQQLTELAFYLALAACL